MPICSSHPCWVHCYMMHCAENSSRCLDSPSERFPGNISILQIVHVQVDRIEVLNRHTTGTASAIRASGDSEAATRAGKAIKQQGMHFVWTQLTQLADMFERR